MDFHRIRRVVAASALALAAAACATTPPLRPATDAPTTFDSDAVAHVVRVIDEHTIVVGRGARDGFLLNGAHDVAPRPAPTPAHPTPAVRFGIRSAVADVVTLGPDETTLTVRNVVEPVRPGDYLAYTARVPVALEDDPVTRCALLDVGMLTLDDKRPLLVLSSLLEGGKPASEATLAAMVKEVNDHADLAAEVHNVPFDGGRFVGLTMSQAFRQTTRDDMLAFVDFVATFPGKYLTWDWKLVEIYGTWIVNRAPHGDSLFLKKQVSPLESAARAAVRVHDWKAAAAAWRQILAIDPNHAGAKAGLDHIEALSRAETMLAVDPDERQVQWDRAKALSDLDLDADALLAFEALIAAGYRSDDAHRQRAFALAGLGRWADAEAELTGILAGRHDAGLENWLAYVRAQQRLAAARGAGSDEAQAEQQLVLGQVHENDEAWSAAATAYRRALDLATTPELRERAKIGQLRVTRRDELGELRRFVATDIGDHDIASTRARADQLLAEYDTLGLADAAAKDLDHFADLAGDAQERDVQAEWLTRLVLRRPKDPDPWTKLGWCQLARGRTADGMNAFERALGVAPNDLWARTSKAWSLVAIGRWDDALALARPGAGDDGQLALIMARASIGKGDLAAGRDWARTAVQRDARWGEAARAAERLAALPARRDATTTLTRVRMLMTLELPTLALAEVERLEPSDARRDAAWAIAERWTSLVPGDWALRAARLEGGSTPMRRRVLTLVTAQDAFARDASTANRRALAEALVAVAAFDQALALIGGGTAETTGDDHRPVDATLLDVRARALAGVLGVRATTVAAAAAARSDWLGAANGYAEARAHFVQAGAEGNIIQAAYDEVRVLSSGGRRDAARALGDTFLERARADKNPLSVLDFEILRGRNDAADGDAKALEAAYDRHLAVCRALEREHCEAVVRMQRADLETTRGRAADAVADAEAALALWRGLHDAPDARSATARLAVLRRMRGELRLAATLAEGLWREASREADGENERAALLELGTIAVVLGDAEAARRWFRAAYAAAERTDDAPSRAVAAFGLGGVALDLDGDKAAAATELERARRVFEAHKAIPEAIEVTIMQARAEPARALALTEGLVERARDLGRDLLYAEALTARARALLAARRAAEARPLAALADGLLARIDVPEVRARVAHLEGQLERERGDEHAATEHFAAAARAVAETLTGTGGALPLGSEDTHRVIDDAIAALYKEGRTADALEIVELQRLARSQRLLDLGHLRSSDPALERSLAELGQAKAAGELARARLREEADKALAEQDPAAKAELVQVAARSDQEIAALLLKLQRDHRGVYGALAVSPLTLVQQRASLPKDVVVVDYFAAADALYAFVVRRDDPAPRAFKIDVPRDRLTRTIARHRQLLGQDGRLADASARDLYTWLLAPLDGLVPAAQREAATVVVIAEGPLQYVPFAALVASPEGAPVVYAVERWRLATALSTTVFGLFEPALARPATQSVLAFLDPTGELAGARNELDGVADVTALRGAEATSQAFMAEAQRFPILHFATHGSIDQADPLASGLRMAGGMLSIDAITGFTGLRGHTRLVVLSACQTATEVGDVADAPEDEAISMARGFAIAGVPSVVASLWDVDDQATRALMQAFYAELASPKRDILGALRAAQIRLLRGAAGSAPAPVAIGGAAHATETERPLGDPRFWSGFQLIGDWR